MSYFLLFTKVLMQVSFLIDIFTIFCGIYHLRIWFVTELKVPVLFKLKSWKVLVNCWERLAHVVCYSFRKFSPRIRA